MVNEMENEMVPESQTLAQQVLNLGEERMGDVVNQLLANESFVSVVQTAITQGLAAKRTVDSTVGTVLGAVNVPSLDDVDDVRSKLLELEDVLAEVESRSKRLLRRIEAMATAREQDLPEEESAPVARAKNKLATNEPAKNKPATNKPATNKPATKKKIEKKTKAAKVTKASKKAGSAKKKKA